MNEIHEQTRSGFLLLPCRWISPFVKHSFDYFLNKHQETVSLAFLPSLKYSNVPLATYNVKSLLPPRKKHETCALKNLSALEHVDVRINDIETIG